jgi:hypothetical protein
LKLIVDRERSFTGSGLKYTLFVSAVEMTRLYVMKPEESKDKYRVFKLKNGEHLETEVPDDLRHVVAYVEPSMGRRTSNEVVIPEEKDEARLKIFTKFNLGHGSDLTLAEV